MEIEFIDDLYPHQLEALETLQSWEKYKLYDICGGVLAFKMGLGKTRTILELVYLEKKSKSNVGPTLVVCNKSNIQVWKNEIEKFYRDDLKYYILHSAYNKNIDTMLQSDINNYDIIITTYEVVRKQFVLADPKCFVIRENNFMPIEDILYKRSEIPKKYNIVTIKKNNALITSHYTPIYSKKWNRIVSDESQKFVGIKTLLCYSMIALNANAYFCLSGTPIVNYATDLYSLFRFMGFFCLPKDWKQRYYIALGLDSRIIMKDYADTTITLPSIEIKNVNLQLTHMEKTLYNECVTKLKQVYALFIKGQATFAAPLAMFTRLRQICVCSYILTRESKRNPKGKRAAFKIQDLKSLKQLSATDTDIPEINSLSESIDKQIEMDTDELFDQKEYNDFIKDHDNIPNYTKIKKTLELVYDIIEKNGKVLIFSSFVSVLDVLKKLIKKKYGRIVVQMDGSVGAEKRNDMVKYFNENEDIKIFLSSYKAGGLGINLTRANYVILLEPWWNSATEEQAICRSHRIGQTQNVTVYALIAVPSFETYLIQVQQRKHAIVQEYIKEYKQQYNRLSDKSTAKDIIQHIINDNHDYYI